MIERRWATSQHFHTVVPDDVCIERPFPDAELIARAVQWYYTAQTTGAEATTEIKHKQELERELRGAIEGVTGLPPERIIIDVDGR